MKISLWSHVCLSSILCTGIALASEDPFNGLKCKNQVQDLLSNWGANGPWLTSPTPGGNEPVYESPTDQVGQWVQLRKIDDDLPVVTRITAHTRLGMTWVKSDCHTEMKISVVPVFKEESSGDFTDDSLEKLLKSGKKGVIYLWSPSMPYSIDGIKHIRQTTEKLNLELMLVLDSQADQAAAIKAAKSVGISSKQLLRNRSIDLLFRRMENHFPSMIVYSSEKLSNQILPGLALPELCEKYIQEHLK